MPSQRARYLTATHEPRLSLGLELALSVAGDLGQQVPGAVDEAALPQALRQDGYHRADQPGAAVGDDEQRWPQPTLEHPAQEGGPGGGRLAGARLQAEQVGLAGRGETPATSTGSADAPGCIRKWLPSRERYSSSIGDRSAAVAVELGLDHLQMRLAMERETVACGPSASAGLASTSRTEGPRTKPAMTSASRAWVLVTPLPSRREANATLVPRSLRRAPGGPVRRWS